MTGLTGQQFRQQISLIQGMTQQQLGRHILAKVILRYKGGQYRRGSRFQRDLREKDSISQVTTTPDKKHLDTGIALVCQTRKDIDVTPLLADVLLLLDLVQAGNLITKTSGLFVFLRGCSGLHLRNQVINHSTAFPFKK